MAAATALSGSVREEELNPEGHTTRIVEKLPFFGVWLPFDFEQFISFKCFEMPTSWSLRLSFRKELSDGSVTCDVTVQRIDNEPLDMGTDFWMRPILPSPYHDLWTVNLTAEGMLPNHQGRRTIPFMPNDARKQLRNSPLQLELFFRIRNCHRNTSCTDLVSSGNSERFRPPTAFEEMVIDEQPWRS